ncbi:Calml3 [Symbiodinium microadriaticum]|nr:Calml3 [Symbiodinium microadriaticum]
MTQHLSPEEIAEFREIFNLVDRDGGGSITKEELGELMDTLGIDASPEELETMINEIDSSGDGEIDFEEFVEVMSRKVNATYTADQVKNAFRVFEGTSPAGCVKADSLIRCVTVLLLLFCEPDTEL